MAEPIHIDSIGWCFVCKRENVTLRRYRQHDGTPATACADERACARSPAQTPTTQEGTRMTNRPRLYPRHQHEWADACPGCGDPITPRYQPFGVCQNCYGTTDHPEVVGLSDLVACTVCGLQMPRNAAGLDGTQLRNAREILAVGAERQPTPVEAEHARLMAALDASMTQPEQETRTDA